MQPQRPPLSLLACCKSLPETEGCWAGLATLALIATCRTGQQRELVLLRAGQSCSPPVLLGDRVLGSKPSEDLRGSSRSAKASEDFKTQPDMPVRKWKRRLGCLPTADLRWGAVLRSGLMCDDGWTLPCRSRLSRGSPLAFRKVRECVLNNFVAQGPKAPQILRSERESTYRTPYVQPMCAAVNGSGEASAPII